MDVQKLIIDNGSLNSRLKNSSSQMKLLQEKVEQIKSSRRYGNNFYSDLVDNLNQLFECPLSMAELTSPTILPSGITVQEDYCNELMKRGSKDPYNKTLYVRQKIVNRFVLNVKEVLSESQMKITAEQAKFKDQQNLLSVEIQTDFIVRSKDDIAKIDLLKKQNRRFREKLSTVTKNYDKLKLFSHNQENVLKLYEHHLKKVCFQKPKSPSEFLMNIVSQSKDTNAYNLASLSGYMIFASMRNQFAMGVCYLIRLMDTLYQKEIERKKRRFESMRNKDQNQYIIGSNQDLSNKQLQSHTCDKKSISKKASEWMKGIEQKLAK